MIISVGVDGSGYHKIQTGPSLLVSFTHTDNMLLWITQHNGRQGSSVFVFPLAVLANFLYGLSYYFIYFSFNAGGIDSLINFFDG